MTTSPPIHETARELLKSTEATMTTDAMAQVRAALNDVLNQCHERHVGYGINKVIALLDHLPAGEGSRGDGPRAVPSADGWRTIDSAPKDGTPILLWSEAWEGTWGVQMGSWRMGCWETAEGAVGEDETEPGLDDEPPFSVAPTHWFPIPEAPR